MTPPPSPPGTDPPIWGGRGPTRSGKHGFAGGKSPQPVRPVICRTIRGGQLDGARHRQEPVEVRRIVEITISLHPWRSLNCWRSWRWRFFFFMKKKEKKAGIRCKNYTFLNNTVDLISAGCQPQVHYGKKDVWKQHRRRTMREAVYSHVEPNKVSFHTRKENRSNG